MQLTKALLAKGFKVLAGARNPPDVLKDLDAQVYAGQRTITRQLQTSGNKLTQTCDIAGPILCLDAAAAAADVDVNDEKTLQPFKSSKIDLLIITAGSQAVDTFGTVTKDIIRNQMETNAIGPLFAVKALESQLRKGGKVCQQNLD